MEGNRASRRIVNSLFKAQLGSLSEDVYYEETAFPLRVASQRRARTKDD